MTATFQCPYDGETFGQRSRFERHMASSHPPRAPSAADLEKAVAGIDFPKNKRGVVQYAARRVPGGSDVMLAIRALPNRVYRDAADLAMAFREEKSTRRRARGEREPPSVRGGRAAARKAVSAAAVAKILGGIHFPRNKSELVAHARSASERVRDPGAVISALRRLPERRYRNMADVERAFGEIA